MYHMDKLIRLSMAVKISFTSVNFFAIPSKQSLGTRGGMTYCKTNNLK